jgi:hypothetical protein
MTSSDRMRAGVSCQQSGGPQFVRIAKILGLLAGQGHQPGLGFVGDLRGLAGARAVVECRHHPSRTARRRQRFTVWCVTPIKAPTAVEDGSERYASRIRARSTRPAASVRDRPIASSRDSSSAPIASSITRRGAAMAARPFTDEPAYTLRRD